MRFVGCFGWFPLEVHIKCPKWKLLLAKTPLLMQLSLPQKSSHGSMGLFAILSPLSVFKKPHFSHLDTGQLPPVTGRCCEPGEPSSGPLAVVMMTSGLRGQLDVLIKRCKCICTYTIHTHIKRYEFSLWQSLGCPRLNLPWLWKFETDIWFGGIPTIFRSWDPPPVDIGRISIKPLMTAEQGQFFVQGFELN